MAEPIKVGDKLAFRCGYRGDDIRIHKVTKITPTGRIVCGPYTLNPNLSVRGGNSLYGPTRAEPVTDKILETVGHKMLVNFLSNVKFKDLPLEKLKELRQVLLD